MPLHISLATREEVDSEAWVGSKSLCAELRLMRGRLQWCGLLSYLGAIQQTLCAGCQNGPAVDQGAGVTGGVTDTASYRRDQRTFGFERSDLLRNRDFLCERPADFQNWNRGVRVVKDFREIIALRYF